MMPNFVEIVVGTPYWVWILLAYLLFVGVNSLKSRTVYVYRLGIMPLVFITWSMISLYNKMGLSFIFWLLLWCIGIPVGYYLMHRLNISVDKETKEVYLPGSFIPLILSCIFFLIKYCLGVSYALNPELKLNLTVAGFDAMVSGFISGISLGRFLKILQKFGLIKKKKSREPL